MREDAGGYADANTRALGGSPSRSKLPLSRRASQPALLAAVLLIVLTLTALPYACGNPGAHMFVNIAVPAAQPKASATATKTFTRTPSTSPSPSATVASVGAGSLALVSPANAQGPVGASLTLSGSSWRSGKSGQTVSLSASATTCSASGTTSLGQAPIDAKGDFTATIIWPTNLASPGAAYALCATSDGAHFATAPQSYRVRSVLPPALALSLPTVGVGQQTQIGGANFVGAASVKVTLTTTHGPRTLATITPDPKDGSFTLTFSPTAKDLGSASLDATSSPDGDAPPAMQATAQFQVVAAVPTTTAVPPAPSVAIAHPVSDASSSDSSLASAVLLAVGTALFVLLLIGAVAWIFLMPLRSRRARRMAVRRAGGPARNGGWGSPRHDARVQPASLYPPDDFDASSGDYPTLYPHDAPTVGPAREWRAPSHVGVAPRVTPHRSWRASDPGAPASPRRNNGTWAPSEPAPQSANPRAPGRLSLPSLDSGVSQASTNEGANLDESRWDR